jgi:prepilin-type N-terminal cleavage/methylation domain-containing protein
MIKNLKSQISIFNLNKGYTLVELLAVTSIIVVISGLIVGILYSTLRGGNKTKVTNDVSQNGNYAMSVIANTILSAQAVTQVNGIPITDCTVPPEGVSGKSIQFEEANGNLITYACDSNSIASSSGTTTNDLIDISAVKVDPNSCTFTCFQNNANPYSLPIIKVVFTVSQQSSGSIVENAATSTFNTSVAMRNYNPR